MGHFIITSKKNLDDLQINDKLSESDFASLTPNGTFVQMKYVDEEQINSYKIKPGLFVIKKTMEGFKLEITSFTNDKILESFLHTSDITNKIDCFFNKLDVYRKYGIEIPKRAMLLFGPAGSGKTTSITKATKKYLEDPNATIIIWPTDKYEAYEVKDFFKTFDYQDVNKLIFIIEDIGGVEMDGVRMKSDSSLLSLLDNQEKTFKIPTMILATTNHPENFLGNLTNRPQRFDDKIKVGFPPKEYRVELLKFFLNIDSLDNEIEQLLLSEKCKDFTPAHLKDIPIRSELYDKNLLEVLKEMISEIELYKKAFSDQKAVGFQW